MDSKGRRHQVDERRFIADLSIAEEFGARDMATASVSLNALPIVNSLQYMLARLRNFQLNYHESSILPERQQINWTNPEHAASSGPELRVQRRDYQAGIEARDIAAQQRFEPGFRSVSVERVVMVGSLGRSVSQQFGQKISPFVLRCFRPAVAAGCSRRQTIVVQFPLRDELARTAIRSNEEFHHAAP